MSFRCTRSKISGLLGAGFWGPGVLVLGLSGCSVSDPGEPARDQQPLQPLIYTEFPNVTPEASAVRERRLMRQLTEGAVGGGQWGNLETGPTQALAPIESGEALGKAIFKALLEQDEELWEHVFVRPQAYSGLVHVDLEAAREFVDNLQGKSVGTWSMFGVEESSETSHGGLGRLLTLEGFRLGEGRTINGPLAKDNESVVQYWGNALLLRFKNSDVIFELLIPKILRVPDPARPGEYILAVGSEIRGDHRLQVMLEMGLHLKAELMRSREYPYPLKVGNFWRYRRYNSAVGAGAVLNPLDVPPPLVEIGSGGSDEANKNPKIGGEDEDPGAIEVSGGALDASEVLVEVLSVDRYETIRLVKLLRTYNDQRLSRFVEHWLLTPRHIYQCNRACQNNIGNVGWLLGYLEQQTPIYRFPLTPGGAWKRGGVVLEHDKQGVFRVDDAWHSLETGAGSFTATVAIDGTGSLGLNDPHLRRSEQRRYFAVGKGVVKRVLKSPNSVGNSGNSTNEIIEELVEVRIIP